MTLGQTLTSLAVGLAVGLLMMAVGKWQGQRQGRQREKDDQEKRVLLKNQRKHADVVEELAKREVIKEIDDHRERKRFADFVIDDTEDLTGLSPAAVDLVEKARKMRKTR